MARQAWSSTASKCAIALALGWAAAAGAEPAAPDVRIDAQLDKTTVEVGQPVTLTITLSGDLAGVQLPPPPFPQELIVAARSQSTSLAIRGGVQQRSTALEFVLVPQQAGTFTLGPFPVVSKQQSLETPAITLTVNKSALPPTLRRQSEGPRYSL